MIKGEVVDMHITFPSRVSTPEVVKLTKSKSSYHVQIIGYRSTVQYFDVARVVNWL